MGGKCNITHPKLAGKIKIYISKYILSWILEIINQNVSDCYIAEILQSNFDVWFNRILQILLPKCIYYKSPEVFVSISLFMLPSQRPHIFLFSLFLLNLYHFAQIHSWFILQGWWLYMQILLSSSNIGNRSTRYTSCVNKLFYA